MRAAYHRVRDLRVGDKATPEPAANEVLLSVSAVGVCGSDLTITRKGSGPRSSASPSFPAMSSPAG